jgi:hypothetical protein
MKFFKRTSVLTFVIAATFAHLAAAQGRSPVPPASPIEATLVIPDSKLLPGVPFDMWIEVRNPSDASVGLGLCADMIVKPEGAEAFTITFREPEKPFRYPTLLADGNGEPVHYLKLRPRQREVLTVPIQPELHGPEYFDEPRLMSPGKYRIALRLDYCSSAMVILQKPDLPPEFLGAVTTNEVVVERITPTGNDAKVWQRMQESSKGEWSSAHWDSAIINEIIGEYPDSNYYPYALLAGTFGAVDERAYNRFVGATARFANSPVVDMLELSAWGTAVSAGKGMAAYRAHYAKLQKSKRPTTRVRAFGREDAERPPCPPSHDCED